MPFRILPFVNDEIYHIYNRGSEKRIIYQDRRDYNRFLKSINYYQLEGPKPKFSHFSKKNIFKPEKAGKIVKILAYCLMPNHFHLLIKQEKDNGITEMLTKLSLSYTKYFNTRHNRVGPLFQGEFKAVHIEDDEQLIHVSRYIHLNPIVSLLVKDLGKYEYSSYHEYAEGGLKGLCSTAEVLGFFRSTDEYLRFIADQTDYGQTLERIKHQLIEEI